jgi:hypothetical protein
VVVPDVIDPADPVASARYLRCDITDRDAVAAAHASIEVEEGRLDVLVNSAGVQRVALTDLIDPEDWDEVIWVNLIGAFNWCRLALRTMKQQRSGAIVNVGSVAVVTLPWRGPHTEAYAGLMTLARTMAVEVATLGIPRQRRRPPYDVVGDDRAGRPAMAWSTSTPCGARSCWDGSRRSTRVAKAVCFIVGETRRTSPGRPMSSMVPGRSTRSATPGVAQGARG